MGFSTGFLVIYNLRRKVVRDPALIAEYYIRHSTFVLDLLAALPVIAEVGPVLLALFYLGPYLRLASLAREGNGSKSFMITS